MYSITLERLNQSGPIFQVRWGGGDISGLHVKNILKLKVKICGILGRNKSRSMCQNAYLLCLQGIYRMRRSTKEEKKTDVWSDKKLKDTTVGE